MATTFFWGEGGQYGPYGMDADGWPNAGEVVRDFRIHHKQLTPGKFAEIYWNAVKEFKDVRGTRSKAHKNGEPISAEWIIEMELKNRVPTDIKRRRIIAKLLEIPPMLFGLASLEPAIFRPQQKHTIITTPLTPTTLQTTAVDLSKFGRNSQVFWHLHYTDSAYKYLNEIVTDIQKLENLEQQGQGKFVTQVHYELCNYYMLAASIASDQRKFKTAYSYDNQAVRVAKELGIPSIIGSALYRRGYSRMEWALYSEVDESGMLKLDTRKIHDAIADYEEAMCYAHPQLKGLLSLELGRAKGVLKVSQTDITVALKIAEQAGQWVGIEQNESFDSQVLQTSMGLNMGRLYLGQAVVYNATGRAGKANEALDELRELKGGKGIPQNHTRRHAWMDIVQAEAYMGLKEYDTAAFYAKNALAACQDIKSETNIVIITDLYSRLRNSTCSNTAEVAELGTMLRTWYTAHV